MFRIGSLVLALSACGKSEPKASTGSAAPRPAVTIDVEAVNALVPAAIKDKLVFEKRDFVIERGKSKTTYTLAAPRGWTQSSKMFVHVDGDSFAGMFTRLEVGSNCDGQCTAKPWEAIADRVNFAPRTKGKVIKDEKSPGRRVMIAEVDGPAGSTTDVVVAWWADGETSYHTCTAKLGAAIKDAAPAFEKACLAVAIDGND